MQLQFFFELTLMLDSENFSELFDRVFYKQNEEYETFSDNDKYIDDSLAAKGITVKYYDGSHKKKVKLTVNPNMIMGNDVFDHDNISKMLQKLETHISGYFDSKYGLYDFKLARIGIITDIDLHDRETVTDYLKVLKRIGQVKGFSPSDDYRLSEDVGLYLKGNSNGIEVMVYDFETLLKNQLMESDLKPKKLKKAEGILRVEVWLKPKAIRSFSDGTTASEQISDLLGNGEKVLFNILVRIIPIGDHYKKKEALEIIRKEVSDRTMRRKMQRLLVLIPEKKSLLLAQKALNYRRINEVMYEFYSINLSPVTISKRHEVRYLKNIYEYFLETNCSEHQ